MTMTRRALIASSAALLFPSRHLLVDLRAHPDHINRVFGSRIYVDGEEIHSVWFVDTRRGVVKSYDVLGDRQAYTEQSFLSLPQRRLRGPSKAVLQWGEVLPTGYHGYGILSATYNG